jgi:hypothetical protein
LHHDPVAPLGEHTPEQQAERSTAAIRTPDQDRGVRSVSCRAVHVGDEADTVVHRHLYASFDGDASVQRRR